MQGDVSDAALSDNGGSFANLSAPASLQSFDFGATSPPGSPASYQALLGHDSEERGTWLSHQVRACRAKSALAQALCITSCRC